MDRIELSVLKTKLGLGVGRVRGVRSVRCERRMGGVHGGSILGSRGVG